MNAYAGELMALATSLFFTTSSTFFTFATRRFGSMVVNRLRLLLAILFLTLAHFLLGVRLPVDAGADRWLWFGISGVIGLTLGDAFLFQAYLLIGARLTMLMMSLSPVIASLLAWVFFHEKLSALQVTGILVTLLGVAWVVLERNRNSQELKANDSREMTGLLFGLSAAAGQALGLVTAKQGLAGEFPALSGTLMRMVAAAIVLWAFTLLRGQGGATFRRLASAPRSGLFILGGAFSGPFVGVTLSLLAIQRTEVGIASTLMALPPVFLLPVSHYLFKERFGWQAVAGTLVAMAGVALLFLV